MILFINKATFSSSSSLKRIGGMQSEPGDLSFLKKLKILLALLQVICTYSILTISVRLNETVSERDLSRKIQFENGWLKLVGCEIGQLGFLSQFNLEFRHVRERCC